MLTVRDKVRIRVVVDDPAEAREVERFLQEGGASEIQTSGENRREQGILPILIIVGAIAGVTAAADLIMRIRDKHKCQELIDARGAELKVTKNCDFKDGRIVVIGVDSKTVEIHDVPPGLDVTHIIEAALKDGADAVKALAEAAGAKVTGPRAAS